MMCPGVEHLIRHSVSQCRTAAAAAGVLRKKKMMTMLLMMLHGPADRRPSLSMSQ